MQPDPANKEPHKTSGICGLLLHFCTTLLDALPHRLTIAKGRLKRSVYIYIYIRVCIYICVCVTMCVCNYLCVCAHCRTNGMFRNKNRGCQGCHVYSDYTEQMMAGTKAARVSSGVSLLSSPHKVCRCMQHPQHLAHHAPCV